MKQDGASALADLHRLDEIARRQSPVHRLHPLSKLGVTLVFLVLVTSCAPDTVTGLFPFLLYPVLVLTLADLPASLFFRRLLVVEPLILWIGLLNPLFDRQVVMLGTLVIAHGWLTLISILLKGSLTVLAVLLLLAVTGLDKIAGALRSLHVPRLFVTIFLLVFRYLSVLGEETTRIQRAYALRAPGHPGIRPQAWGSLAGQLLLRSFDRAERVYQAMALRGFTGDYPLGGTRRLSWPDAAWFCGWIGYFLLARFANLPQILGSIIIGACL